MEINRQAGFCLLETAIALTAGAIVTLLLLALLHASIMQSNVINHNLMNARQALVLYQLLKNNIHYGSSCKAKGSQNTLSGSDILNITCCSNNICESHKIYLSSTRTLMNEAKSGYKEQILRGVCEFKLQYGIPENKEIKYYSHGNIADWQKVVIIQANVSICSQAQSFSTNMEFAL